MLNKIIFESHLTPFLVNNLMFGRLKIGNLYLNI